jgi:hypothetical protein
MEKGVLKMREDTERKKALLRTFDLPDIHFNAVVGLEASGNTFSAERTASDEGLSAVALDRWYEQSRLAADAEARRDCWLQIDGRIYVIWGASINAKKDIARDGGSLERWEFSFDEMRRYRPIPS